MILLAIDPGYSSCGWVVFEDFEPVECGGRFSSGPGSSKWNKRSALDRSLAICADIQGMALRHNPDLWVTERFYDAQGPGRGSRAAANYGRGTFDGLLRMTLGHIHGCTIHPKTLKKWATNNGNAKKTLVVSTLYDEIAEQHPNFLVNIRDHDPKNWEHLVEAYGLGTLAGWLWRVRRAENPPAKAKLAIINSLEKQGPDLPIIADEPVFLPETAAI